MIPPKRDKAITDFQVLEEPEHTLFLQIRLWTRQITFHLWVTLQAICICVFTTYHKSINLSRFPNSIPVFKHDVVVSWSIPHEDKFS